MPRRQLFRYVQRDRYLESDNVFFSGHGDTFNCSNFVDIDWLSSSGNSCEEEPFERYFFFYQSWGWIVLLWNFMEQKYETAEHESIYLLENAKNRAWFNKKRCYVWVCTSVTSCPKLEPVIIVSFIMFWCLCRSSLLTNYPISGLSSENVNGIMGGTTPSTIEYGSSTKVSPLRHSVGAFCMVS